ncbi:MAG: hypothetical protein HY056_16060 [Proteobacteria bacterium]|nr:hypothetical protein [Pseudomonadota bacterium]
MRAEIGAIWRCAFYLWSADGLSRSVLHVDLESGLRMTAPDAAFHVGCVAEVHLIAEEFRAWRSACGRADALERYLEDVAA